MIYSKLRFTENEIFKKKKNNHRHEVIARNARHTPNNQDEEAKKTKCSQRK